MTTVDRHLGAVGSWTCRDEQHPVEHYDRSALRGLMHKLQCAARILEDHELLSCTEIEVIAAEGKMVGKSGHAHRMPVPAQFTAAALVDFFEDEFDGLEREYGFSYPNMVNVLGTGVVLGAGGERLRLPNVTWLCGMTAGWHILQVHTQSDAWMPYALDARPQAEVHRHNAPRLERALRRIGERLSLVLDGEDTRFAVSHGLRLQNQTYGDGEVVDCSVLLA